MTAFNHLRPRATVIAYRSATPRHHHWAGRRILSACATFTRQMLPIRISINHIKRRLLKIMRNIMAIFDVEDNIGDDGG